MSEDQPAEEQDIEIFSDPERPYFWTEDPDEQRRCFIFDAMTNADIEIGVLIKNMQACFDWIKTGEMQPAKRALKVVKE